MRSVLITGGGRGIGREAAKAFAREGAAVTVMARTADAVASTVETIRQAGGRAHGVAGDVRRPEDAERAVAEAEATHGVVDVLVNNAGVFRTAGLLETSPTLWSEVLDTNLTGAFLVTQVVVRRLVVAGLPGVLVNVSSVAGRQGFPGSGAYCASKFGLAGLGEALREELRPQGILVLNVFPGQVDTDAWNDCGLDLPALGIQRDHMMKAEDVGRALADAVLRSGSAIPEELVLKPPTGG